ncbi:agmatinase [Leisingera sp. HS039]|uniref:agmatinase n=1 Tax=unclassified Leisingera TaxID=2614906 RepID=UPI0010707366|nr:MULTISPECIES: agmatinase [unclassified Leisingera]MBQ4825999.1 agmatinase [Leisingera sp. HS039]MCF6432795.1 agmatinase [Leisingera sp. MMG026]QBR38708.1 agmatinase [Leisingera sp. NJS201]
MTETSSVNPVQGDLAFTRSSDRGVIAEASYAGALSFMRRRYTRDLSSADVAVMGVPFDLSVSSRSGTRLGPRAVRSGSSHIAWSKPWPWEADPYEALRVVDYGDCEFDYGYPHKVPGQITQAARDVLASDTALLSIGGDHFITYPLLKAHAEKHGPLSLIQFDAHSDTWADEEGRIDHGTMLWHAIREGLVDPARSVQVGIRTHNPDPMGMNIIDAIEVQKTGPEAVAEKIRAITGDSKTYVTFDIDALEPASAPGTGTPVIGGLSPYQAQEIIRGLAGIDVAGMDVVEVAPAYDISEITAIAAATIANDLLCLYAAGPSGQR